MMIEALGKWCMQERFEEKFSRTLKALENCRSCLWRSLKINFSERRMWFRVMIEIACSKEIYSYLSYLWERVCSRVGLPISGCWEELLPSDLGRLPTLRPVRCRFSQSSVFVTFFPVSSSKHYCSHSCFDFFFSPLPFKGARLKMKSWCLVA